MKLPDQGPRPAANSSGAGRDATPAIVVGRCTHRDPEDDFFCLRYQLWYPSVDCAYRTLYRTAPGCQNCDQGRFNLKRHAATLTRTRHPLRRASRD